jgi:hypothetical protein
LVLVKKMPVWLYQIRPLYLAIVMVAFIELLSLIGLLLTRRFLLHRFSYGEGINDAISGTVQVIGVFYGITVGLIAIGVWNTNTEAAVLVSQEATAIGALYEDLGGYPEPLRGEMRAIIKEYTVYVIDIAWPAQQVGKIPEGGVAIIDEFQTKLYSFEPATNGQMAIHSETLRAFNHLIEYRRLRIDAVESGLSDVMWSVIWIGAAITIGVAYFFRIQDGKLHAVLVALMGGFLAIVLFMIVIHDKPFFGYVSISSDPYKIILKRLIDVTK